MASGMVTARANSLLTADLKTATVYGGLFTADPTDTGATANEVADLYDYARTEITFGDDAATRTIDNSAALEFPAANGGSWGTVTHLMITTSATHGATTGIYYGALTASKAVGDGDQLVFAAGNIDVTISAGA